MDTEQQKASWPEAYDRIVVEQMLRHSPVQWHACQEFVMRLVRNQTKNIAPDHWEDIMQDAMVRIHKSLPNFKYECALKTWLYGIVRNCIIDDYRKTRQTRQPTSLDELYDDPEHEGNTVVAGMTGTVEDEYITHDELGKAVSALREYVSTHAKPARNGQILEIVLFEGYSIEEAAKVVGCSAAVVGYVVRSGQRYVREKLGR